MHEYNFDCDCGSCKCITKHFHLKTKKQAKELGFDLTEDKPKKKTIQEATKGMYFEIVPPDFIRYPNICNVCGIQFDCTVNALAHCNSVHPGEAAYITTWVILSEELSVAVIEAKGRAT